MPSTNEIAHAYAFGYLESAVKRFLSGAITKEQLQDRMTEARAELEESNRHD